jgi:hypothetical protein
MFTRNELITQWYNAAKSGTLLTPKHDPNNLSTIYASSRTVLTPELSASLETFISGGNFNITEYHNARFPRTPYYFELEPRDPVFSVAGSGVPAHSPFASGSCDRLVVVSGSNQGWHSFAENSYNISGSVASGVLHFKGKL